MKKIITSLALVLALVQAASAQTDASVSMGGSYANNVWYSFENGIVGSTQAANNWDIALAATFSPTSSLATSVLFNYKVGTLFIAPVALTPVDDFDDLDTNGMANTWQKLYNDDRDWASGAFNQTATGHPDYGWGTYDPGHTGLTARRIFVIRYTDGSAKKLTIALSFVTGSYTIKYDKLDGSAPQTATVLISDYSTKNFVYYSLTNNTIIDREPASSTWDMVFTQYISTSELYKTSPSTPGLGAPNQPVGGILLNNGLEAAQVNDVADRTTFTDYASQTFSTDINIIGWDWKYLNASFQWKVVSDSIYFVKLANDDIYKLYFTSFGGTSTGTFNFTQEKLSTVTGVFGEASDKASLSVYPNPTASGHATVLYDFSNSNNAVLTVSDLTGNVVYSENIPSASGLNAYTFSTSSLKTGLYIVSLSANGGVLQQKLMVK